MKRYRLIAVMLILIIIAATALTGCNAKDKLELLNALEKSAKMNSWESQSRIRFSKVAFDTNIENLALLQAFLPLFDKMAFETHQKVNQSSNGKKAVMQTDTKLVSNDITDQTTMWASYDFEKQPPSMKQVIKLPAAIVASLPEDLAGKQYFVMDQKDLPQENQIGSQDYTAMMQEMTNFQSNLVELLKKHALKENPNLIVVNQLADKTVNGEKLSVYQLKLDNKSFKTVLGYVLTELSGDEQVKDAIKEVLLAISNLSEGTEGSQDIIAAVETLTNGEADFKDDLGKIMSALDGVTLLGDRGIEVNFLINKDGYIINQNGVFDFYIDSQQVEDAFEELAKETEYDGKEIYKFTFGMAMEFNTAISNINQTVKIDFPAVTKENSFDINDFAGISQSFSRKLVKQYSKAAKLDFSSAAAHGVMPVRLGDKTFLPLSPISKKLGLKLELQKNGEFVLVTKKGSISGKAGSMEVLVYDKKKYLPLPVMKIENQIFVPDQFITQCLNTGVYYNEKTKELTIHQK